MNHFRLDRALTLCLFHPWMRRNRENGVTRLPILMYHSISNPQSGGTPAYYETATSPHVFAGHMRLLQDSGYRGVDLETGLESLRNPRPGAKMLAITFDDGFRDFLTAAVPELTKQDFTATMFVPTGLIRNRRCRFKGRECLTWSEVKELRTAGMRFGSHTVNHPKLHGLAWDDVRRELRTSKKELENQLQEEVVTFAYPYAFPQEDTHFSLRIADLLCAEGYRAAATTIVGRAEPTTSRFHLPRLPVNSFDDARLLLAKLAGAYDWAGKAQRCWRAFRARRPLKLHDKASAETFSPAQP